MFLARKLKKRVDDEFLGHCHVWRSGGGGEARDVARKQK